MGGEWREITLGGFVTLQRGHDLPEQNRVKGEIPILGSFGVTGWHNESKASGPGVTVGRSGASFGVVSFSPVDYWPLNTALYVKDFHGNHPKFVYYFLRSIDFTRYNSGSAQPSLNRNHIHPILIEIPSFSEQKAIAHILGSLDDKIELNRQMNSTLEAMAQALFKSWFVDFDAVIDNALAAGNPIPDPLYVRAEIRKTLCDKLKSLPEAIQKQFPSRFVLSEKMGWIPEGWEIKDAQEIASITIGKTPPRKEAHWFTEAHNGNVVWVSIRDMGSSGVFIGDSSEYLVPESIRKFNVKIIPKGSVLLSFKLTLGRVAIAQKELTTNEAIAHFVNPKYGLTKEYLYIYLKNFDYEKLGSTSSIATAVNSKLIKAMPFVVPSRKLLESFHQATGDWFVRMSSVSDQTETLTKLRDTLLPKLLSGELHIPDAEKLVADAV